MPVEKELASRKKHSISSLCCFFLMFFFEILHLNRTCKCCLVFFLRAFGMIPWAQCVSEPTLQEQLPSPTFASPASPGASRDFGSMETVILTRKMSFSNHPIFTGDVQFFC